MEQLKFWVALSRVRNLGTTRFRKQEAFFSDPEHALNAGPGELRAAGLDARTAAAVVDTRRTISPDAEMARLEEAGVRAVTWHDPDYPSRLKQIDGLPPVLYVKGALIPDDERAVAVVGTRSPTTYGREAAPSPAIWPVAALQSSAAWLWASTASPPAPPSPRADGPSP